MDEIQSMATKFRIHQTMLDDPNIRHTGGSDGDAGRWKALNDEGEASLTAYLKSWHAIPYHKFLNNPDILKIADMVIPLGKGTLEGVMDCGDDPNHHAKQIKNHYTCKNLIDGVNCGIYDTRPAMCADYPYAGACDYIGCTDSSARGSKPQVRTD